MCYGLMLQGILLIALYYYPMNEAATSMMPTTIGDYVGWLFIGVHVWWCIMLMGTIWCVKEILITKLFDWLRKKLS